MLKSIFTKYLYQKRFSTIFWCLGLFAITLFTMSFFPYFKEGNFDELLKSLPKGLQNSVGSLSSTRTLSGYVGQQIYALRIPLFTMIMAIGLFVGLSAGDEERGTLQTLLTQPVSRSRVYVQKLLASCLIMLVANVSITLGILASRLFLHQNVPAHVLVSTLVGSYLLSLVFGSIGFALGSITGRRGFTLGITSAIAIASYLINSLAPAVSKLESADKLSIFHYYNAPDIALHGLNWTHVSIQLAIIALLITVSCSVFNRRDINSGD